MNAYINKIYDMLYSPILTPYNLLENVKLSNYQYVKYYTNSTGIIAEMQCLVGDEEEKIFYYQFDEKDYLQSIYYYENNIKEIFFDRTVAIEESKENYYKNLDEDSKVG